MKKISLGILIVLTILSLSGVIYARGIERNPAIVLPSDQIVVPDQVVENSPILIGGGIANKFVQDEIVVKFKEGEKPFRVIKVSQGKVLEEVEEYKKRSDVVYAEPNYIAYSQMVPNDPYYKYQWHLDNPVYGGIGMEEAWSLSTGAGVTVAVVDTGIRKGTDLAATCFVSGYDFVNSDSDPIDDNGHGTHVAGTVAQSTNNSLGVAGVAFRSCLMPVKVLNSSGSGTYTQVADGIYFAADNRAKVINLSLGGSADSVTLKDAVAYAYGKGVIVVAAAGNDNSSTIIYPAAYDDYVIAVGATQYDETKAPYSNYGPSLDLMAPGGNTSLDQNKDGYADGVLQQTFQIRSTIISWGYYFFQGTSMAAPHVSGVAALLIANGNATAPDQIRTALQTTAEDKGVTGRDDIYGYGLVDAYAALGWTSVPSVPDTTPPVISIVTTANITSISATVTWTTDESSNSVVNYGATTALGSTISDTAMVTSHSVNLTGLAENTTYYYEVQSTDSSGNTATDNNNGIYYTLTTTVAPVEVTVFEDSFEISEWNGLWTEDSQNDWFRSTQRAVNGKYSAEVDGLASNAKLTSIPINLQARTNATITFSWFIESGLDLGEYLAFDVSTDGGTTWVEKARLRGNVDPENTWHNLTIDLTNISNLQIQFRGKMSDATEDANVDIVKVVAQ